MAKPILLRQVGSKWTVYLDVDAAIRRVLSRSVVERLRRTYPDGGLVPVAKNADGKLGLVPGGAPARFRKKDALGFAHQIGYYGLNMGNFVDSYADEERA